MVNALHAIKKLDDKDIEHNKKLNDEYIERNRKLNGTVLNAIKFPLTQ